MTTHGLQQHLTAEERGCSFQPQFEIFWGKTLCVWVLDSSLNWTLWSLFVLWLAQIGLRGLLLEAGEEWSWADKNRCNIRLFCSSLNITGHKKFSIDFHASSEDLDKITEEDDLPVAQGKRKAASKAAVQQRKILLEDSDGKSDDSEPGFATGKLQPTHN